MGQGVQAELFVRAVSLKEPSPFLGVGDQAELVDDGLVRRVFP